jgi:hypothetical protein
MSESALSAGMSDVTTLRLNLMRLMYFMITLFLGTQIWPLMFHHQPWDLMHGVACSLLAALGVMMAIGIRYPLQMVPILLFEIAWKSIWLIAIALPLHNAGKLDAEAMETVKACVITVILGPLIIPWPYVWFHYVRKRGDRWRSRG